jgi:hypothetical protein
MLLLLQESINCGDGIASTCIMCIPNVVKISKALQNLKRRKTDGIENS